MIKFEPTQPEVVITGLHTPRSSSNRMELWPDMASETPRNEITLAGYKGT